MNGWSTQAASDVIRNGLGIELLDSDDKTVAEVFRCDDDNSVRVTVWSPSVTKDVLDWFLPQAHERLAEFESGSPISSIEEWPVARE